VSILTKTKGRPKTDHFLTLDMAKELAMVERSEIGRETRRYFIQMEKAARDMAGKLPLFFLISIQGFSRVRGVLIDARESWGLQGHTI
jgi:AntA/AntB antirepressor